VAGSSMSIKKTAGRRFALGAIPRLSLLSCGRKVRKTESHSTVQFGSRTLMCAPRQDGARYLVSRHCRCQKPRSEPITRHT
jgi:hypothetical protein